MRVCKIAVTTTGSPGAAVGTGYSVHPYSGWVVAIKVDWHASAPNTSDITVTSEGDPAITYYTKANANTDVWVYPKVLSTDNAAANLTGEYQFYPVVDRLKVSVADCDALTDAVVVYVFIEERS
jgi:hypothetical protein